MNKNTKGILVVAAVVAVAGSVLYFMNRKKIYATAIVRNGKSSNYKTLLTFEVGYLQAWAKAARKQESEFSYGGGRYRTDGGTKIA